MSKNIEIKVLGKIIGYAQEWDECDDNGLFFINTQLVEDVFENNPKQGLSLYMDLHEGVFQSICQEEKTTTDLKLKITKNW